MVEAGFWGVVMAVVGRLGRYMLLQGEGRMRSWHGSVCCILAPCERGGACRDVFVVKAVQRSVATPVCATRSAAVTVD